MLLNETCGPELTALLYIMPTHPIRHPHQHDRLRYIPPRRDQKQRKVPDPSRHPVATQQDDVSHGRDHQPEDDEPKPMPRFIR